MRWPNWMRLSREPDDIIGVHAMLRWFLIPQNDFLSIYLHKHQANDPRTHHDHPADNITLRLAGELFEYTPTIAAEISEHVDSVIINPEGNRAVSLRADGSTIEKGKRVPRFRFRKAEDMHRLELVQPGRAAWTIWIRFRERRAWGFFDAYGWRPRRTRPESIVNE